MISAYLLFLAVQVVRGSNRLLEPRFYAEDGWNWYPDAYNHGFACLIIPYAGYLQTFSRLVALLAQAVPLERAPLVFAAVALLAQAVPPVFLLSQRTSNIWPDPGGRAAFALLWISLPDLAEIFGNVTDTQWHLAPLMFLILLSRAPAGWLGRASEALILLIGGLSGPFSIILVPVATVLAWQRQSDNAFQRAILIVATASAQIGIILLAIGQRSKIDLGATAGGFVRIVSEQIVLGLLIGYDHLQWLTSLPAWHSGLLPALAMAGLMILGARALWRGNTAVRLAIIASSALLAAELASPGIAIIGLTEQWPLLELPGIFQRFYYIPNLAWLLVLFTAVASKHWYWKISGAIPLLVMLTVGIPADWNIAPFVPTDFVDKARLFDQSPPGTVVLFDIAPVIRPPMRLVKH